MKFWRLEVYQYYTILLIIVSESTTKLVLILHLCIPIILSDLLYPISSVDVISEFNTNYKSYYSKKKTTSLTILMGSYFVRVSFLGVYIFLYRQFYPVISVLQKVVLHKDVALNMKSGNELDILL
jgi:hypothetical protein